MWNELKFKKAVTIATGNMDLKGNVQQIWHMIGYHGNQATKQIKCLMPKMTYVKSALMWKTVWLKIIKPYS